MLLQSIPASRHVGVLSTSPFEVAAHSAVAIAIRPNDVDAACFVVAQHNRPPSSSGQQLEVRAHCFVPWRIQRYFPSKSASKHDHLPALTCIALRERVSDLTISRCSSLGRHTIVMP